MAVQQMYKFCNMNNSHCQLGRSLERILEEAHLSGELKLSNRKLKDFPKSATKYDLSDTVYADLSRNRFSELPEEITQFAFLETLILYHNTIRTISENVKGLSSLTYLDLRSNQLNLLPREICFLPIRVLLIANNRLTSLPEELGRMDKLTELDASCNLLSNLPPRMGDLKNLKSLSLRNNQLVYIPREITTLSLISLNLSSNRISSLPVEIRLMTTLVDLNLENNPLTSPPAGLCVRGLVHVFKFLDMQATKDDCKLKSCGPYDGYTTLRRASRSANGTLENKSKKNPLDSITIINDGLEKLLLHEGLNVSSLKNNTASLPKPSVMKNMQTNGIHLSLKNPPKSPNLSYTNENCNIHLNKMQSTKLENSEFSNNLTNNLNSATVTFDDGFVTENNKIEDKNRNFGNIQTYKEYKEALKQQRNQEIANLYKTKANFKNSTDESDNVISPNCNVSQQSHHYQQQQHNYEVSMNHDKSSEQKYISPTNGSHKNGSCFEDITISNKKPVQKVIPSRNITTFQTTPTSSPSSSSSSSSTTTPTSQQNSNLEIFKNDDLLNKDDCFKYAKPKSPTKCNGIIQTNNTINSNSNNSPCSNSQTPTKAVTNAKTVQSFKSSYRNMNWDQDMPSGKLSFTMRREFDKQKEETELIAQLRSIIETRLKMNVPDDLASALTDGVILCHLANCVRPRSVASIHVPSPGVPKLTMARCRRNVDNFLEACRKIGIDEELICSCEDVVSSEDITNNDDDDYSRNDSNSCSSSSSSSLPNPSAVLKTISALIEIMQIQHQQQQHHRKRGQLTPATNQQQQQIQEDEQHHCNLYNHHQHHDNAATTKIIDNNDNTTCKNNHNNNSMTTVLNVIDEAQEYANENDNNNEIVHHTCINVPCSPVISKLKIQNNEKSINYEPNDMQMNIILNNIELEEDNVGMKEHLQNGHNYHHQNNSKKQNSFQINTENFFKYEEILNVNNLNKINVKLLDLNNDDDNEGTVMIKEKTANHKNNCDVDDNTEAIQNDVNREVNTPQKIVTKRIEFFENNTAQKPIIKSNDNCVLNNSQKSVIFSICKPLSQHSIINSNLHNNHNKCTNNSWSWSSIFSMNISQDSTLFTIFLSCIFLITFLLLIIFPITN